MDLILVILKKSKNWGKKVKKCILDSKGKKYIHRYYKHGGKVIIIANQYR